AERQVGPRPPPRRDSSEVVDALPAEIVQQSCDLLLRPRVVARDEEVAIPSDALGRDHDVSVDRVERLDDFRLGKLPLYLLSERDAWRRRQPRCAATKFARIGDS